MQDAYRESIDLLERATTDSGILASLEDIANYRRIWCRDGIICGLAGALTGRERLVEGLASTLETLAQAQGPDGQIPSNVRIEDGEIADISYGGVCGRVDTLGWFTIGAVHHAELSGDDALANSLQPVMERALALFRTWEYNRRGLVYVPQGGDWADEFILRGYVLNVQLLRLWALRCYSRMFDDPETRDEAASLEKRIERNFWPTPAEDPEDAYHPWAYRRFVGEYGEPDYWLPGLAPSGYTTMFDGWSNAIAVALELGSEDQRNSILDHGLRVAADRSFELVPAFWPPIRPGDARWTELRNNFRDTFSNEPGRYHNGGLWPVANGWWGVALRAMGRDDEAQKFLERIYEVNRPRDGVAESTFPEYLDASDGTPGGVTPCTWSAAGAVLLKHTLDGDELNFR